MEKEIKKINTYIEMLEVAQQHFEAKGDTKNAEFCTIKINSAKEDIVALQAGYEVDMAEYNSLVSDVEEDVVKNIEEPVYEEVNSEYEIVTLEEANKKTTKKGRTAMKYILSTLAIGGVICAIIACAKGCSNKKGTSNGHDEILIEDTTEAILEEESDDSLISDYMLPTFTEVDLDGLIYEASQNITVGELNLSNEELVRYLEVINYDVHENEMDVEYEEVNEIMNKLRDSVLNKSITKINNLNGIEGTFGYDSGNLLLSDLVVNDELTKDQLIYLENLYTDMLSEDVDKNKEALIKYLVLFAELTGEVDNYSVDGLTFAGEEVIVDHSVEYNSMNSAQKGLLTTQITAMYPLASVLENKLFNDATLDRPGTILGDSEDLEGGNTENQNTIQHISADSLMKDFNEMVCSDEISTDDENEYPINEYSNIIIGWKFEANNSKKEAIIVLNQ